MIPAERAPRVAAAAAAILLIVAGVAMHIGAQKDAASHPGDSGLVLAAGTGFSDLPLPEPAVSPLPLPEDRGEAALEQALKRLGTTASLLMIVAHPDDEDGPLLTYLSRGLGVRCTLLTLTRGEGGQNAMSDDLYDALGLIRTNELLKADEYYGTKQLWGTEADFGFSKTQEESFARWGHDRVLYDAVLAVRRTRPQVIVSTFIGGITDGHGQHQVSGEIAQEAFKAAGDPKIFPEQLKDGLQPWQPFAVYSMVPFAPVTDRGMFDYATGKWAPAKFKNYVTGEWSTAVPSTDATLPVGNWDLALGRSYTQIATQGWGEQKSQNGGADPGLSGPATTSYHLWAAVPAATARPGTGTDSLFDNTKIHIDTSVNGIAGLTKDPVPDWLASGLGEVSADLQKIQGDHHGQSCLAIAHALAPVYHHLLDLRQKISSMQSGQTSGSALLFELDTKIGQIQDVLRLALGLDLTAFTTKADKAPRGRFRGGSADETPRSVAPGEQFKAHIHTAQATKETLLNNVRLVSAAGDPWKAEIVSGAPNPAKYEETAEIIFNVRAAANAEPTAPYFTRASIEQPYYELSRPEYRERSFAPYPLVAWAEFTFEGLPIEVGQVVQTLDRVTGPGGIYEPLAVAPAIGVRVTPEARILPLDGSALPVAVTVHAQATAKGTVELKLPSGWRSEPAEAKFHLDAAGDTEPIRFSVTPTADCPGAYSVKVVAHAGGRAYESGWRSIGYAGLRPYSQYTPAALKTRKVDVKLAPSLKVAYVMGPGDLVPEAIEGLGVTPHLLTDGELATADLGVWNVIVIGIRAYSTRPALGKNQARLDEFVRQGGTLIVQYQSATFPAPLPITLGGMPERVVDEQTPVKLLDTGNPLFKQPNLITTADFDGWVEERGHGFPDTWDKGYTTLTETADPGQDPQRGGLLAAHLGRGTYIYVSFALYRQLPELVPGAYRLLANLLSAGKKSAN